MNKVYHRFFAGAMKSQARWLNKMSERGYRLVNTEKTSYEFEECEPGKYEYCVEYVGDKSKENADSYKVFLEEIGYKVWYKNINLNYSTGKVAYNPFAEKGGRVISSETTLNRELFIIERTKDTKPFELHTSLEDKLKYYRRLRNGWIYIFGLFTVLFLLNRTFALGVIAAILFVPLIIFGIIIMKIRKEMKISE